MKKEITYKHGQVVGCPLLKIGTLNLDYCIEKCDYHCSKSEGKIKCNYWNEV